MALNNFPLASGSCLEKRVVTNIVLQALREDIGAGDITSQLTIPASQLIKAEIIAQENCLVCGVDVAMTAFKLVDKNIRFSLLRKDGEFAKAGQAIALISGSATSILTAERVALNLLSLMSGVSTKTRAFVDAVKPFHAKIVDTRKTIPGLRLLQKYAVGVGGGYNHRLGLDTMVLIKDNHIKIMGGLSKLPNVPSGMKIEVEAQSLEEFLCFLRLKPDVIMLDNMGIPEIKKAVEIRNKLKRVSKKQILLEASGGVQEKTVRAIASTGVDIISVGSLTHSTKSINMNLDIISGVL